MNVRSSAIIFMLTMSLSVQAEVFKCKSGGKIVYQHEQCATGEAPQAVIRETSPQKVEEDKLKLRAWQDKLAAEKAEVLQAEKQRQAELEKQESLELQRRSVMAQEKQALAEQQRVITEQQRQNQPIIVAPPYGRGRYWNNRDYPPNPPNSSWDPNMQQHHHNHDQEQHHGQSHAYSRQMPPPEPQDKPGISTNTIQRSWSPR